MTTTTEAREKVQPEAEEEHAERMIEHPLLLAALLGRREERGESLIEHPLLLAALMRRRHEERGGSMIEHP
ncbi:hypothetical protein ABZ863_28535, partial [Saccharomonospora sp. NPDC046836]|uniref:hypothetical protein n=1 Tax=Saccharomonospora sp. NPDC046836 TaxID=3156921 RepID=UPI0033D0E500